MAISKFLTKYDPILIIVLIPVAIIASNVTILATNFNFYTKIYQDKNIYDNFSNKKVLEDGTHNLLGYFRGKNLLDQNFYSSQATRHLKDVKNLLNITKLASFVLLISIFLLSFSLYLKKAYKALISSWVKGALLTLIFVAVICSLLLLDFQKLFFDFHLIFFRNNDWLFEPTDNLVKMFPQEFFTSFALYLAGNIIATTLFIAIFAQIIKNINDKSDN